MVTKSKAKSAPKAAAPSKAATKTKASTAKPDFKAAAAADKPEPTTTAEQKADTVVTPKAEPKNEEEKFGAKLRRKGAIMNALRAGSTLVLNHEGLWRMANPGGSQNPVSKRRAASIVAAGLVKLTKTNADGKHYIFDPEAEKKAQRQAEATDPESK